MTRTTTASEIRSSAEREVQAKGLELDEFIALGTADELDDADLRELWLLFKGILSPGG